MENAGQILMADVIITAGERNAMVAFFYDNRKKKFFLRFSG